MRGKGQALLADDLRVGITPACAGKSNAALLRPVAGRDHPRVCGEKPALPPGVLAPPGSPPRMRGKAVVGVLRVNHLGITPAYAGKRQSHQHSMNQRRDHPRVCGEKVSKSDGDGQVGGSPPRMRGKVTPAAVENYFNGITPACAGKSAGSRPCCRRGQDHPRVCGEKSTTSEDAGSLPGSPPRMRGKVVAVHERTSNERITPAYAGKRTLFTR